MEQMQEKEIIEFLKKNIEPLNDNAHGTGYRASVHLIDGTFLPCVIFRNKKAITDLAIRRFDEEKTGRGIFNKPSKLAYYDIVKHFVTSGNCINVYDVGIVEKSKFAFPLAVLKQIHGETSMAWTCFVGKMKDGKCFSFGTTFLTEFFNMPEGYSVEDIDEIINHSYMLKTGEIKSYYNAAVDKPAKENIDLTYRERPYFECYLDNL